MDFNHQVQNVVNAHSGNVDVVKADNQELPRPRRWDYVDYDDYHRPTLYNPLTEAMTFRYFYDGAYREVYVPAGGRVVLDVATVGVFPFTAVGDSYLVSGSFYGGALIPPDGWTGPPPPDYTPPAPPEVYHDVSAYVPADNQTVQVGQVTVVGHDDSQPAGSQDTFLLDDTTLAWGQVNDPSNSCPDHGDQDSVPAGRRADRQWQLLGSAGRSRDQPTHPTRPTHSTLVAPGAALRGVVGSSGCCRLDAQSSPKQTADLTGSVLPREFVEYMRRGVQEFHRRSWSR